MKYEELPNISDDNRKAIEATFGGLINTVKNISFKKALAFIEYIPLMCRLHHISLENRKQKLANDHKHHPIKPRRGDIYNALITEGVGSELAGNHPVVVVSNPRGNIYGEKVNVLPIEGDGSRINPNYQVQLNSTDLDDGVLSKNPSRVIISDIMTIDKARIDRRIGRVGDTKMKEISQVLKRQLDLG